MATVITLEVNDDLDVTSVTINGAVHANPNALTRLSQAQLPQGKLVGLNSFEIFKYLVGGEAHICLHFPGCRYTWP